MSGDFGSLSRDFRSAAERAPALAKLVVQKTASDVQKDAQLLAPVDTGYLRQSIGQSVVASRKTYFAIEVGPTAEYGEYVEHGTSRQAPQPYLGPAVDRNLGPFEQAMSAIVEGLF